MQEGHNLIYLSENNSAHRNEHKQTFSSYSPLRVTAFIAAIFPECKGITIASGNYRASSMVVFTERVSETPVPLRRQEEITSTRRGVP